MVSTTSETPFWVPGAVVPHEPFHPHWDEGLVTRWVVHANGPAGQPSTDVQLAAMSGGARVLLATGHPEAHPSLQERRRYALQLLTALPGRRHDTRTERRQILDICTEPQRWSTATLTINGNTRVATRWTAPTGTWCLTASDDDHTYQLAASGTPQTDVHVRTVTGWAPYGLDLEHAQSTSSLASRARSILPLWEGQDPDSVSTQ